MDAGKLIRTFGDRWHIKLIESDKKTGNAGSLKSLKPMTCSSLSR
jgi:hypothetical protein